MLKMSGYIRRCSTSSDGVYKIALQQMIDTFRTYGHLNSTLNPLTSSSSTNKNDVSSLLASSNFTALFKNETKWRVEALMNMPQSSASALEMYEHLERSYCANIGIESSHVHSLDERHWLSHRMESQTLKMTPSMQKNAFRNMAMAETFEHFVAKKFTSFKRYSGEGAESLFPALDTIFHCAAQTNVDDIVIGMPHRGRLALLVSLLEYPSHQLFHKIKGFSDFPKDVPLVDDVSSHIATSCVKSYGEDSVKVSLVHNPSHLEIINAVVTGKVRAKRHDGSDAMAVLMHGDAAFAGQGCVPESLILSQHPDYDTGGTIHIIVNNQIGFTTKNEHMPYVSEVAKCVGAPILHVHGESLPHVVEACKIAMEYRNLFKKDIILDLITYRRHGHNEVDEPAFTEPQMYDTIRTKTTFPQTYGQYLAENKVLTLEKQTVLRKTLENHLEEEFHKSKTYSPEKLPAFDGKWKSCALATGESMMKVLDTGVPLDALKSIGKMSVETPDTFTPHERLQRTHIKARLKALQDDKIDWATAEALAFGSLLQEGHHIRLAGQDSQRGTFSQRHAILIDQNTGEQFMPFSQLPNAAELTVVNT